MSLDTVANPASSSRADASRGASSTFTSKTDPSSAPGGFAALMQSLGGQTTVADPLASAGSGRNDRSKSSPQDNTANGASTDAAASAAAAAAVVVPPPQRDTTPSAGQGNATGSNATGKAGALAGGAKTGAGATDATDAGTTASADGAGAPAGSLTGDSATPYLKQVAFLQQLADANAQAGAGTTAQGSDGVATPGQANDASQAQRLQALMSDALNAAQSTSVAATGQPGAPGADAMTTLALAGLSDASGKSSSRLSASDSSQGTDPAAVALMGATTTATGAAQDVPAVAPDAGATTEMRVAQQVTYWVGKGVQNAAMEVQGIAERPIQVSISVQGQDARITLQAEQAQTQQILQGSAPHLKDLLQSQGLVLSSFTVGGSGAGATGGSGSGGATPQDTSGSRQGQVLVPEATGVAATTGGTGRSGSALDLFV